MLVMLCFLGFVRFDLVVLPTVFAGAFISFYLIIQAYLYGFRRAFLFLLIAIIVSFLYDKVLLNNGLYEYNTVLISILKMPIAAILTWSAAIFQAYHFNTGVLYALRLDKPIFAKKEFSKLFLLMVADGCHLMTIGLMMEYLIVKYDLGTWSITSSSEQFDLPIFYVLMSYFVVGVFGSGIFRIIEFFRNEAIVPIFNGYKNIFGLVYLVCFLISIWILIDVNFSPIFVIISVIMLVTIILNDRIYKRSEGDKN